MLAARRTVGSLRKRFIASHSLIANAVYIMSTNISSTSSLASGQGIVDHEIDIDVIVPVYNAFATLRETVESALFQVGLQDKDIDRFRICVCCYDDGSTDQSWGLLTQLVQEHAARQKHQSTTLTYSKSGKPFLKTTMRIARAEDGVSRGAGYARNRAVAMREKETLSNWHNDGASRTASRLLAMLDSDDVMRPTRLVEQAYYLSSINETELPQRTLVGCNISRDPPQSTWHYTEWANGLSDERLVLEKFREVTLLQPTWMMYRSWFQKLGGYLEAPSPQQFSDGRFDMIRFAKDCQSGANISDPALLQLIDTSSETPQSLRVAEDTRFFYKHLHAGGQLRLLRTENPLLMYRHREGHSQSSQTSRKLLLRLRVRAFEHMVLENESCGTMWSKFCVWGAGRDGKDFVKALRPELRRRIFCMVDVDEKKINSKHYVNNELNLRIPILHFSVLAKEDKVREELLALFESGADSHQPGFGRIRKSKDTESKDKVVDRPPKRPKICQVDIDESVFPKLPVVVCVAMYRTGGALEFNVNAIGRTEGVDLWHFS